MPVHSPGPDRLRDASKQLVDAQSEGAGIMVDLRRQRDVINKVSDGVRECVSDACMYAFYYYYKMYAIVWSFVTALEALRCSNLTACNCNSFVQ